MLEKGATGDGTLEEKGGLAVKPKHLASNKEIKTIIS